MNIIKLQKAQHSWNKQLSFAFFFFQVLLMFPGYSVILTCSPSYKLVSCTWASQIFLSKQCNIQNNLLTGSHSYCSRRLHFQVEPPTFSLFHVIVITCCHHFLLSCCCHLLLHALVSAVYSTSASQVLVVVVDRADGYFANEAFGAVSCLHSHCLNLGLLVKYLKVHSKTCLLRVFSILLVLNHFALHVSFLHLKLASETIVALTSSLAVRRFP